MNDYQPAPDELRDAYVNDADVDAHDDESETRNDPNANYAMYEADREAKRKAQTIRSYPPGSGEYNDIMFGASED